MTLDAGKVRIQYIYDFTFPDWFYILKIEHNNALWEGMRSHHKNFENFQIFTEIVGQ